jgi:DNA repair exonuclease SbcCD nuclease subunit
MIWSTDWHVADNAPDNRIDDYTETCFKKIEQIKSLCKATKADICLIGGDIFHVKTSSKVRHALVARLIETFRFFPCPVWSLIGNHDISHNNIITLPEKPMGVLFSSKTVYKLDDEIFSSKDGLKIRIVGKHFDPTMDEHSFDSITKGNENWLLVAYHGFASVNGISFPGELTYKYSDLLKLPVDDWFFGHWHIDQGIYKENDHNFVNVGSLTRGALTLENISRTPKAVICTYDKHSRTLQQVKLNVEPADRVFDIRKKERSDREQVLINQFIDSLKKETMSKSDHKDDINDRLNGMDLDSTIKDKVVTLLLEAEVEIKQRMAG